MISIIDALGFVVVTAVGSFLFGRLYERINLRLSGPAPQALDFVEHCSSALGGGYKFICFAGWNFSPSLFYVVALSAYLIVPRNL